MSTNNEKINNRRSFDKDFSISKYDFLIKSSNIQCIDNDNKNLNGDSLTSLDKVIFKKKFNEQNSCNNNFITSNNNSMMNLEPFYNKRKINYFVNNEFKPNPNIEEIPTFSYENDLNVKSFKNFMNKRSELLKKNYENYIKYMKKHENEERKKTLISPYSQYVKKLNDVKNYGNKILPNIKQSEIAKLKMKFNNYENQNDIINKNNMSNFSTSNRNRYSNFNLDNYLKEIEKNKKMINNQIKDNNKEKVLKVSKSVSNIGKYFPKNNEISNPELFFKKGDQNFHKYRERQKKFDEYNYRVILNHHINRFIKKEPDINPFNPRVDSYKIGNSSLPHNIILRPGDSYGNFKNY